MRKASTSKMVSKAAKQMRMFTKLALDGQYLIDEQCCDKDLQVDFPAGKNKTAQTGLTPGL